jgi:hypothetical protein
VRILEMELGVGGPKWNWEWEVSIWNWETEAKNGIGIRKSQNGNGKWELGAEYGEVLKWMSGSPNKNWEIQFARISQPPMSHARAVYKFRAAFYPRQKDLLSGLAPSNALT